MTYVRIIDFFRNLSLQQAIIDLQENTSLSEYEMIVSKIKEIQI